MLRHFKRRRLGRKVQVQGSIDRVSLTLIRGWSLDPTSKEPVTIELRTEAGELLTRAVANEPRPDVGRRFGTDGRHGFWVPLPMSRSTAEPIQVFACSSSGETLLTVLKLADAPEVRDPANVQFRDTLVVANPDGLARALGSETLVICGPSRGGTSLVSYVLLNLGYPLGEDLDGLVHEDKEILAAIAKPSEMDQIIAERNRRFKRWGFKVPHAVDHVGWLAGALRNPVFLIVFRNPFAIAKSLVNRDPSFSDPGLHELARALEYGVHKMDLGIQVVLTGAPSVLIDVDAARGTPEQLVRDLANLFVPNTSDQIIATIARDINSPGYKSFTRTPELTQPTYLSS